LNQNHLNIYVENALPRERVG